MGTVVLNPVQVNCPGRDIFELKRSFGQQVTFAVRRLLDEVAADMRRRKACAQFKMMSPPY